MIIGGSIIDYDSTQNVWDIVFPIVQIRPELETFGAANQMLNQRRSRHIHSGRLT
jgi:hypothetical protein